VTTDPRQYRLDRRAAIAWSIQPVTEPHDDSAFNRAQATLQGQVGPPYQKVGDLIPHPVPEGAAQSNPALEEWRWGKMPDALVRRVDGYVKLRVTPQDVEGVLTTSALDDVNESGFTLKPRDAAKRVLGAMLANPMSFLETAFGEKAGG
jgi:hypothetical protein